MRVLRLPVGSLAILLALGGAVPRVDAAPRTLAVRLTLQEAACPALGSKATGVAVFHLRDDGSLDYRLVGGNIASVFAAHIHLAATGGALIPLPPSGDDSGVPGAGTIPTA